MRQNAIITIKKLSKKLGPKWCEKYALNMFQGFISNPNYLYRENALFGFKVELTYKEHRSLPPTRDGDEGSITDSRNGC